MNKSRLLMYNSGVLYYSRYRRFNFANFNILPTITVYTTFRHAIFESTIKNEGIEFRALY